MKRAAILFYGQPRFIEKTYRNIIKEFTLPGYKTDVFYHFWEKRGFNSVGTEEEGPTREDLLSMLNPVSGLVTDYKPLDLACEHIFNFVKKEQELVKNPDLINHKTIFSITQPNHLEYFLGQMVSIKIVANLMNDYATKNGFEYDIVYRVRTDLYFPPPIKPSISNERALHYVYPVEQHKECIICTPGGLRMWADFKVETDNDNNIVSIRPEFDAVLTNTEYFNTKRMYSERSRIRVHGFDMGHSNRDRSLDNLKKPYYLSEICTLHLKDWLLWGTHKSMFTLCDNLLGGLEEDIIRCRQYLNLFGINYEWGAGELVTGETIRKYGLNAYEIPIGVYATLQNQTRCCKVINAQAKENLFSIRNIVREDLDKSLDDQILELQGKL